MNVQRYADTALRILKQPRSLAILFALCLCVVFLTLGRGGSIAKHVSASSSLDSSVARIASELSKYHRLDLARLVAMREHNLQQVQEEVQALKAMIDPAEDEKRIAAISRNDEPVKRQQHVVIPMVLHMTWKSKTDLPRNAKNNLDAWREKNPGLKIVLYDDADIEGYVGRHFAEFSPYWGLLKPVQKADVFRYVVMWKEGGVYADVDVYPLKPIKDWMLFGAGKTIIWRAANVIIGWEMVTTRKDWEGFFASNMQLCQWTFASSPGHALWRAVLDWILAFYVEGRQRTIQSVIRSTGPGAFSDAVKRFLGQRDGAVFGESPLNPHALVKSSVLVGDVLVLRQSAFGGNANSDDGGDALVRHEFAGSWKTVKPATDKSKDEDSLVGEHQRAVARLEAERDELRAENERLKQSEEKKKKNKKTKQNQESEEMTAATERKKARVNRWLMKDKVPGLLETPAPEKMATIHEVRAGQKQDLVSEPPKTWVPIAARWASQKTFQPLGESEEAAQRRKFLLQRLSSKAAAHVESKQLDEIEQKEELWRKESKKQRKKRELLAPHGEDEKKPFNHGMD